MVRWAVLVLFFQVAFTCSSISGPTCFLHDSSLAATGPSAAFLQGVANQAGASLQTLINIDISTQGNVAAFDIPANCGFVFIGCALAGPVRTLSAADLASLKSFYDAGGVIVLGGEDGTFFSGCAATLNPIIAAVDPSVPVRFNSVIQCSTACSASLPLTSTGTSSTLMTVPNDLSTLLFCNAANSFSYPTTSDPECYVAGAGTNCFLASMNNFIFTTDSVIYRSGLGACQTAITPTLIGENFGAFINSCGGLGGDPHVYPFGHPDMLLDFEFEPQSFYQIYGSEHFHIVVGTSPLKSGGIFIASIGISMQGHKITALLNENDDASFYLNGIEIEDSAATPFGKAQVFVPSNSRAGGPLQELSRYLVIGLKIPRLATIVAGIHPECGGFFNIEVKEDHIAPFGLLHHLRELELRNERALLDIREFKRPALF